MEFRSVLQMLFTQSVMLEKILAKLVNRILRKRLTSFYQRRFSVMLPEEVCAFHDGCKQGINQQNFNR